MAALHKDDKNNTLLVCAKRCDECLMTNNKVVDDERREEIIEDCLTQGVGFNCHKQTMQVMHEPPETVEESRHLRTWCRGFFDVHKNDLLVSRLAISLDVVEFVAEDVTKAENK